MGGECGRTLPRRLLCLIFCIQLSKVSTRGSKPAILHTAAIWRWASDLETGNFVPPGQQANSRVAESRM